MYGWLWHKIVTRLRQHPHKIKVIIHKYLGLFREQKTKTASNQIYYLSVLYHFKVYKFNLNWFILSVKHIYLLSIARITKLSRPRFSNEAYKLAKPYSY